MSLWGGGRIDPKILRIVKQLESEYKNLAITYNDHKKVYLENFKKYCHQGESIGLNERLMFYNSIRDLKNGKSYIINPAQNKKTYEGISKYKNSIRSQKMKCMGLIFRQSL